MLENNVVLIYAASQFAPSAYSNTAHLVSFVAYFTRGRRRGVK